MDTLLNSPFAKLLAVKHLDPPEQVGTDLAQPAPCQADPKQDTSIPEAPNQQNPCQHIDKNELSDIAPIKQHTVTCEYCTRVSHKVVFHTDEEMIECKASREPEPETKKGVPTNQAELSALATQTCEVCGSLWNCHSESALASCKELIDKAVKGLSATELEIIEQFDKAITRFAELPEQINFLLVRQYFSIENKKLTDEQLRLKIRNFQTSYVIGRIGESILTQEGNKKQLVLSEDGNRPLSLSAPKVSKPKTEKIKKSPKEKQLESWVALGMTKEAAQNLWEDTFGKSA